MINDFENAHIGKTCVIIGNGPSLRNTPMEALGEKYITFGANKIYEYPFKPTYWTCVDKDMMHDCLPWIVAHPEFSSKKFIPREVPLPHGNYLNVQINVPFSIDASVNVQLGGTVTIVNLQLAYYMGFEIALLVGVDHNYSMLSKGVPGSLFIAQGEDTSHFSKDYFTPGHMYNRPELEATSHFTYPGAKYAWEISGRRIINLTPNSKLDVFEKDTFDHWI